MKRIALVTGASYGIGAAIAQALARDGYDVAVTELDDQALDGTIAGIRAHDRDALAIALDIRTQASIEACMTNVLQHFGQIDTLVNNAGILLRKPIIDITREEFEAVMDVNVTGTFFMSQQMGRYLIREKRQGAIISLSSTHAMVGVPLVSAYGISKAAVSQMTRMLAIEWASHRIRVNAIAPGTTETPSRKASFDAAPTRRQALMDRIPFQRFCTEEDVAGLASYLASPAAAYITGQTILVDGGLTSY
jgi:2-deoxy-D-gluconate 3-dehydrogenase